jgi:HD-GYP domain-containing protein (c-di-GMP phosphodiesterase class II)
MKNKLFLTLILLCLVVQVGFTQNALYDKYMENARNYYIIKDYAKAYSFISFILRLSGEGELTAEAEVLAEKIYYDYLKSALAANDSTVISKIKLSIFEYPTLKSDRVAMLLDEADKKAKQIEEKENQKELLKQRLAETEKQEAQRQKEMQEYLEREEKMMRERQKMERERQEMEMESQEKFNKTLLTILESKDENAGADSKFMMIMVIVIVAVIVVLIFIFVFIIMAFMRGMQNQQQQFNATLRTVYNPNQMLGGPTMALPGQTMGLLEGGPGQGMQQGGQPQQLTGSTMNQGQSMGQNQQQGGELVEIKKMVEMCRSYAMDIDEVTGRRNCSKNCAELIYKIAGNMGYTQTECMIFYGAGLVYDIGFLNIDPMIFKAESISNEQFTTLKSHTQLGLSMINFIKGDYRHIFEAAVSMHHENLDGSGYPTGIMGDDIPFIARAIRVVESYLAMTSPRLYKDVKDRQTAIDELYQQSGSLDSSIIDALVDVL